MSNSLSTRLDHDHLTSIPRDVIARDASLLLDPLKDLSGERQMAAIAVDFYIATERYGGNPQALYEMGRRVVQDQEQFHKKGNDQLEALRDFAALRMRPNPII